MMWILCARRHERRTIDHGRSRARIGWQALCTGEDTCLHREREPTACRRECNNAVSSLSASFSASNTALRSAELASTGYYCGAVGSCASLAEAPSHGILVRSTLVTTYGMVLALNAANCPPLRTAVGRVRINSSLTPQKASTRSQYGNRLDSTPFRASVPAVPLRLLTGWSC